MAKFVTLANGAQMPTTGLGTWLSPPGAVKTAVACALANGYTHIDCAAAYGNEDEVGAGIAEAVSAGHITRDRLFVTSKLWVTKCYPEGVAEGLNQTLRDLRLDYLDLYLVHWPFFLEPGSPFPPPEPHMRKGYSIDSFMAVWRELEKAVDEGKVRAIGVSNMSAKKLVQLLTHARIPPAVNQVEGQPFLAQKPLLDFCARHNIVVTAYSPLGSPARPARLIAESDPAPLFDPTVQAIATRLGVSPARVLIRWGVQRGTVVIPKSTTPERIIENADVFSFELSEADMAALAALDRGHRLLKGTAFVPPTMASWEELWDTDFDHNVTVPVSNGYPRKA